MASASGAASGSASTLDRAEHAASGAGAPRRRLQRRDTNAQVERILQEQFKGYGPMQCDVLRNEQGRTLREQLIHDKHENKASNKKVGSSYFAGLRKAFPLHGAAGGDALVPDKSLPVDPELQKALSLMLHPNTTKASAGAFRGWLSSAGKCNSRELIGILKAVGQLRPSRNTGNQVSVLVDVAKYLCRHDIDKSSAPQVAQVKHLFDEAFVCQYAAFKKQSMSVSKFVEVCGESLRIVMDLPKLTTVLQHQGDWSAVTAQLGSLVMSSMIGERMFSFAWVWVASDAVATEAESLIQGCQKPLTVNAAKQVRDSIFKKAESLHLGTILDTKRAIKVSYRSVEVEVFVHSLGEECSVRIAAAIKSQSVGTSLPAMAFEAKLGEELPSGPGCDAALVKEFAAARLAVNDYMAHQEVGNGDYLLELMKVKQGLFLQLDPTFKIEMSWLASAIGASGVQKVQQDLLKLLPSASSHMTVHATMQAIKDLMSSDAYRYSCRSAQSQCEAMAGIIGGLQAGTPFNEQQAKQSSWLAEIGQKVPYFVKKQVDENTVLAGPPAIKAILAEVAGKIKAGTKVGLEEVEPVQLYSFVLDAEEKQQLSEVVDAVVGQATIGAFATKRTSSSSMGDSAKKAKREDYAADLFD